MSDKEVEEAITQYVVWPALAVIGLLAVLTIVALVNVQIWYTFLAIIGSYAVVDILMGFFVKGNGENEWFFLWGHQKLTVAQAYLLFFIGVVITGIDAVAAIFVAKYVVDQGFNLQTFAFPVNLLILGLLLLDFYIVYIRSQSHQGTSPPSQDTRMS